MLLLAAAALGIFFGILTGLTPGIHVNLVCSLLLASYPFLPFGSTDAVVFIVSLAMTHTFLDSIPSMFLGAPDSATALGVLPGHRYLLQGNGFMAVKLSTLGALGGLVLGVCSYVLFTRATVLLERVPQFWFGIALLTIPLIMWWRDRKKLAAGIIILLAAAYGTVGFRFEDPLFPMLSGLFGAATLLYSLLERTSIPPQQALPYTQVRSKHVAQALLGGLVAGGLTAVLPGVGAAHAAVLGMLLAYGTGDHGFLVLTGAIGTTNFFLSVAAYDAVEKARNGALIAASTISPGMPIGAAFGAALLAGGVGTMLTFGFGRVAARWMSRMPYEKITIGVLLFVSVLVVALSGVSGLLLYIVGAAIGLIPAATKAARAHAMSCILIPVALRFLFG